MNRSAGGRQQGYTILETMIFLAVSGAMFISAMALINGKQAHAEFVASVRDFESSLSDIAGNVATGYYSSGAADSSKINCIVNNAGGQYAQLSISSTGATTRGASTGCTFIGDAVQFAPSGTNSQSYAVFGMAGLQYKYGSSDEGDAHSINESKAQVISASPDIHQLENGASFGCVLYVATSAAAPTSIPSHPCSTLSSSTPSGLIMFLTTYEATDYQGNDGGSNQVDLRASKVISYNTGSQSSGVSTTTAATDINQIGSFGHLEANDLSKTDGGIFICLQSNGTNQHAVVALGGLNSRFSANSNIVDGNCS